MTHSKKAIDKKTYKKNLQRIVLETILTSVGAGFSVATITMFWNSIGMNQTDIGFVQMAFTIVIFFLDIPMGYIADRFNRKLLNIVGDIGVAFVFVLYSLSKNIYVVLLSEVLLATFMAMTNGVDQSFIKYNCNQIDESGNLFKKVNAKIHTAKYAMLLAATILGGFIAKFSLRLSIGVSFIPYFIGGIIALNIKDFSAKIEVKHRNPLKDMIHTVKEIIKEKKTRTVLVSYIIGREITHSQIWVFTPLLVLVGVPIQIVSIGWALSYTMQIIGGKISEKYVSFDTSKKFAIPVIIEFVWMIVLIFKVNIVTVWLFALNGLVQGLAQGNLTTSVQECVEDEVQTSVMSIASTGGRLLYIPLVYFVNYLGNIELQLALVGVCIIFLPMSIITYLKLIKLEKNNI